MAPTLLEQVLAARLPNPAARARSDEQHEQDKILLDWMAICAENLRVITISQRLNLPERTIRERLARLKKDGRVTSFKMGHNVWWTLSSAELARRRKK